MSSRGRSVPGSKQPLLASLAQHQIADVEQHALALDAGALQQHSPTLLDDVDAITGVWPEIDGIIEERLTEGEAELELRRR